MLRDIPIYFTEKDVPDVLEMLREENLIIQRMLMVSFIDGGKEIKCPMITVEDD